jgi:hypothetical protein
MPLTDPLVRLRFRLLTPASDVVCGHNLPSVDAKDHIGEARQSRILAWPDRPGAEGRPLGSGLSSQYSGPGLS